MKITLRLLLTSTCLAAAILGTTTIASAAAKEPDVPKGSIRPAGKVQPADLPGLAKISFQQALDSALAKAPGSVIQAELEVEDGNLMYSFEIVRADKKVIEVEIDAGNGRVLGTEDESADAAKESGPKD